MVLKFLSEHKQQWASILSMCDQNCGELKERPESAVAYIEVRHLQVLQVR